MHILLIHQAFAALDEPGGTRHHELALYLAARGHRVTVIASPVSYLTGSPLAPTPLSREAGDELDGKVRVIRAYTYQALHKSFVHRIFAFISFMASSFFAGLSVRNVDLVWGTSPPIFQGMTAWVLARLKRVPFLFEVRDLWPSFAMAVGVLKNPTLIKMSLWLEGFLYRHADRLMVNSPGYVAHVSQRGARRVELVPNGADPGMFEPADKGTVFRLGNRLVDKFVLLYAGAHGMSNDLAVVLEAAKILQEVTVPIPIRIVFLGDGKEKPALQKQAAEMCLANVQFLPPVPKAGMPAALAGADACLAILKPIDEYKTTYPNKVFDYMAAGRPVVLAIDGVIRQVVEAAGCGVFARPGDPASLAEAVRSLAVDRDRSRQMGLAGRRYLEEHFSRAAMAEKLTGILEEMVQPRSVSADRLRKE
ncbi:MAG TPA: glycosyltransferase family 4 protein [Anaerolineales bacterium]|nr:glycosyltransferase family 4 protein [Anaerolineales bacterium]